MKPAPPVKRAWPIWATGPLGNRARFDCLAEVPHSWTLEGEPRPAPVVEMARQIDRDVVQAVTSHTEGVAKNKGGRPKKVAP